MKIISDYDVLVVGTGAAGLSCANELYKQGIPSSKICILTEKLGGGTSFNTGSDKQTYYKLSLIGNEEESPFKMAQALMQGGAMHGDIALIEATSSIDAFYNLVHLGVPFPHNKYGSYVGYKTDNDPLSRGTSVGPLTSKLMCEKLLQQVRINRIPLHDARYVMDILKNQEGNYFGVLVLDLSSLDLSQPLFKISDLDPYVHIYLSKYLVLALGGPADLYLNRVYPESQHGSTGLALKAGLWSQNLTESQFGMASVQVKWNVSGSYQQVIPRYISIPARGNKADQDLAREPYEFLNDIFPDFQHLSKATFLKGYQWPFNPDHVQNFGSSLIDLAVYYETVIKHNRVFLDFTQNPKDYNVPEMDHIAQNYLKSSDAVGDTPYKRLKQLNMPAYEFYKHQGIDLSQDWLEIAVCAQHSNGGVTGDIWWETSQPNVFAIGELNGSHGVHRPGGAALNSGQVGAQRAAKKIAYYLKSQKHISSNINHIPLEELTLSSYISQFNIIFTRNKDTSSSLLASAWHQIQARMMKVAAFIRPKSQVKLALTAAIQHWEELNKDIKIADCTDFLTYLRLKDSVLTQIAILASINNYLAHEGGSRGSSLIPSSSLDYENDHSSGIHIDTATPHPFISKLQIKPNNNQLTNQIQMIKFTAVPELQYQIEWIPCRPIPEQTTWFEETWAKFRSKKIYPSKNSFFPNS